MSDPTDRLEQFDRGEPLASPLAAADVRRRGDRLRHRNQALGAVASVVAVVLVAAPVAVFAGSGHRADRPIGPSTHQATPTAATTTPTTASTATPTPTPTTTPTPSVPATNSDDIPADFVLDTSMTADVGDGGRKLGPSETTPGVELNPQFCGASLWPPADQVDRLAVSVSGPEYFDLRELITFENADAAVAALAELRSKVAQCADGTLLPDGNTRFTAHDEHSGYDDVAFSDTTPLGLGADIYEFVRVGRAILATQRYGEYGEQNAPDGLAELDHANQLITPSMCVFTDAGC